MSNSPITRTIKDIFDLKTKQNTDLRDGSIEGQHSPMVMTTDQLLWRQKTYFRGVSLTAAGKAERFAESEVAEGEWGGDWGVLSLPSSLFSPLP